MKLPKFNKLSRHGTLMKNTVMLYILTFSNFFLSFIIATYESRILDPVWFGVLGTATAIMVYFQLVMDFGYLLSGTQEVAQNRDDPQKLNQIFTSVTAGKLMLIGISAVALFVLCQFIPTWQDKMGLYFLFFLATALNALLPDYLYRGLERMGSITVRTVSIRVFFTLGILALLREPGDIWLIPVLTAVGNLVALAVTYIHLKKTLNIHLTRPSFREILGSMKRSSVFFYSRIATTVYSALNTVILDIFSASGAVVGYYNSADKLITMGKNAVSPISDSLYPHMVKNKDFKLVRKVLLILEPLIVLFCTAVFIWAEPLCALIFGAEYAPAAPVLRAMLPVGIIILPSYILGFPTLTAMGLSKHANYSTIVGSAFHLCLLGGLFLTDRLSMVTLALCVSITEAVILLYRIVVILRNRHLLKNDGIKEV